MGWRYQQIVKWAKERNLIKGSSPEQQFLKTVEEVGELADAIGSQDNALVMDAIGDVIVTLTILAEQHGLSVPLCIDAAYKEIKDRKGRMINGIFVKEEGD